MGKLQTTIKRFRKSVLDREEQAADKLLTAYGDSYQRINTRMESVIQRIQLAQMRGTTISRDWVFRQDRMKELLTQVEIEMHGFADFGTAQTTETQRQAVSLAAQHAQELIRQGPGPLPKGLPIPSNFTRFDPSAVQGFIGRSSDGSPLTKLFTVLVKDGRQAVEATFASNIIEGNSPKLLARELRDQFNIPLTRALTISRTEVIGTYRETKINAFEQNNDVVNGWRWTAALNGKTCAMCLAMDGKTFGNSIPFGSHPNCRCTPVPQTKSWEELGIEGIPDLRPQLPTGAEWFAKQKEKTQLGILGPQKLEIYKSGQLSLDDLVGYRVDKQWGPNRWERSLVQVNAGKYVPPKTAMGVSLETVKPKIPGGAIGFINSDAAIAWEKSLTSSERNALVDYSDSLFDPINTRLRNGRDLLDLRKEVDNLDSAASKVTLDRESTVYRGVSQQYSNWVKGNIEVGSVITDSGYMSTTYDLAVAEKRFGHSAATIFYISAKEGQTAIPIERVALSKSEKEILLPRNSSIKVTKVERNESGLTIIHAELM